MDSSRDGKFAAQEVALGCSFAGDIKIGGNYTSVVQHRGVVYVSGQIPRVRDTVMVTGRVGEDISVAQAQYAAKICVMRALALLRQTLGKLDRIEKMLRVAVYVQSASHFTLQSEVADGASDILTAVLGEAGVHTRTSIGVFQLPKNAAVEIDMIAVAKATVASAALSPRSATVPATGAAR